MIDEQLLHSSDPLPLSLKSSKSTLHSYVSLYRSTIYETLLQKACSEKQTIILDSLRHTGYYAAPLEESFSSLFLRLAKGAKAKYRKSMRGVKDVLSANIFRTIEMHPIGCEDESLLQSFTSSYLDFLHIHESNKPLRPSLQLTRIKNSSLLKMKDVHEFHCDAVFPTFKSFIFFPSIDDSEIPYQFTSFESFCENDLLELHVYILEARYWFTKQSRFKHTSGLGQLTWMYSPSVLNEYRQSTGRSCMLLDIFDHYLPAHTFLPRSTLLVITDNSLPHRRSWSKSSSLRNVVHFLPYERLSLSNWLNHASTIPHVPTFS